MLVQFWARRVLMSGVRVFDFHRDEAREWERIQELRKRFESEHAAWREKVRVTNKKSAFSRGRMVVERVLAALQKMGLDFSTADPGHGAGHLMRDYLNALRLFSSLEADPRDIFIGFVGGVLHDIGCTQVERYEESSHIIGHAEAAALMLAKAFELDNAGLNQEEQWLIEYAVAAHTHYTKDSSVECSSDGATYIRSPYKELDADGMPIWPVWFTRWVDRLDVSGPGFVGRHLLTQVKPHKDYAPEGFYPTDFVGHLRIELRDQPTGARSMLEHLTMFANSQTKASPYGRHDYGRMVELRDRYRTMSLEIVNETYQNAEPMSEDYAGDIGQYFEEFLGEKIEPTTLGRQAASDVMAMFIVGLDAETQCHWLHGFDNVMTEYRLWAMMVGEDLDWLLEAGAIDDSWFALPGICADVRTIL
jgi:hypothetical protein